MIMKFEKINKLFVCNKFLYQVAIWSNLKEFEDFYQRQHIDIQEKDLVYFFCYLEKLGYGGCKILYKNRIGWIGGVWIDYFNRHMI